LPSFREMGKKGGERQRPSRGKGRTAGLRLQMRGRRPPKKKKEKFGERPLIASGGEKKGPRGVEVMGRAGEEGAGVWRAGKKEEKKNQSRGEKKGDSPEWGGAKEENGKEPIERG